MNIPYGMREDIGFREAMEDQRAIYDNEERSFFSAEIYDGHGGKKPAEIAAEMLTPAFLHALDREMKKPAFSRRSEADLLRDTYLEVDAYIVKKHLEAGTCAVQLYNKRPFHSCKYGRFPGNSGHRGRCGRPYPGPQAGRSSRTVPH